MMAACQSSKEIDSLLLAATHCGDASVLKTLLLTTANPAKYLNQVYEESEEHICTLFMMAFLNGYEEMVCMLLDSFEFDLEVLNTIKIIVKDQNLKVYENVTILWAAAAVNNDNIIRRLVEHGAQVNHTIKTNSTPLRCVCFHGNLSMVRYLVDHGAEINITKEHHDTNLILSVFREHVQLVHYLVDELKCDINECDDENRSPLYLAVERGSLELVQFLVNRRARNFPTTYDQLSPLMLAAEKRRPDLVNIILPNCSLLERIEASELLASAFASREHGTCVLQKSFEHLSQALRLRLIHHLPKPVREPTHEVFNHQQECQTIDQLNELQANSDRLYIEALLIRGRLLGCASTKYHHSLLHRAVTLTNTTQYQQGIALWMYQLNLQQQHKSVPIHSKQLRYLVRTFAVIIYKWSSIPLRNLCQVIAVITNVLDHSIKEFDYNLYTLLYLITITSQIVAKSLGVDNDHRLFYQLVHSVNQKRYVTRDNGSSLFHLSLSEHSLSSDSAIDRICKYPCFQTVRRLLQCGADVNANDTERNTPVHVFVSNSTSCDESIFQLLCTANAHLDCANTSKQTPMNVACDLKIKQLLKIRTQQSLKCLCARLIQTNNIPFHGILANSLVTFVRRH